MKKYFITFFLITALSLPALKSRAQATELLQLALNIEKLSQLKSILNQLYDGYSMLSKGYTKIRDVASGNYSLHEVFLDGLYAVSPTVKKYRRIPDIITCQARLVSEYKDAYQQMLKSGVFNPGFLNYAKGVYTNLLDQTAGNLDELLMVVTAGKMRMSDDERIASIDRIYSSASEKLRFLRDFNGQVRLLAVQKQKEKSALEGMGSLYGR